MYRRNQKESLCTKILTLRAIFSLGWGLWSENLNAEDSMDPTHPRLSAKVLNMRLGMKEAGDRVHDQLSQESRLVSSRQHTTSTTRNL